MTLVTPWQTCYFHLFVWHKREVELPRQTGEHAADLAPTEDCAVCGSHFRGIDTRSVDALNIATSA